MKNAIHIIYCVCAALVAAEPGLEASMPGAAAYLKAGLAVCAAIMMALRFMDPVDAAPAASAPEPAPYLPPPAAKPASVEQAVAQATAAGAAALQATVPAAAQPPVKA